MGKPYDLIDCFLDQRERVQAPAVLNSVHASHEEAPSTPLLYPQEQKKRSHYQKETLVVTTCNHFCSTETPHTNHPYSTQIPRGGMSPSRSPS